MAVTAKNSLSLEELFESTVERVYSFLVVRCGNTAVAEDLTAETYASASRLFTEGRGGEVTMPWLVTVARRRLIDHWRAERSNEHKLMRLASTHEETTSFDLRNTTVSEVLADLPQQYRASLSLRYLDGFSVSEVAEAFGLSYKAAESLLSRARRAFAIAYEESS